VYDNLKLKNAVSGGEEMLRLRSYEKLQNLVSRGLCAKVGKTYRGLEGLRAAHNAAIAARTAACGSQCLSGTSLKIQTFGAVLPSARRPFCFLRV
jgi:hypothetical protein